MDNTPDSVAGPVADSVTDAERAIHDISVVIPVYRGETTLRDVVTELMSLTDLQVSRAGSAWRVSEVILVHDHGPDNSAAVMRHLAAEFAAVRTVWLSRNFGQHAATLAGISVTRSGWVVTMDEDGQHDPSQIERLLDVAVQDARSLVYGQPSNEPPHGFLRNLASRTAKKIIAVVSADRHAIRYQSFRLILGELARGLALQPDSSLYLDITLRWIAPEPGQAAVDLRRAEARPSGYTLSSLTRHFWRMVLASGTRGLRVVSVLGVLFAVVGLALAIVLAVQRIFNGSIPEGWTSTVVVMLVTSGAILFSLGIIAEYLGVTVSAVMGRPGFFIISDPAHGPLARSVAPDRERRDAGE